MALLALPCSSGGMVVVPVENHAQNLHQVAVHQQNHQQAPAAGAAGAGAAAPSPVWATQNQVRFRIGSARQQGIRAARVSAFLDDGGAALKDFPASMLPVMRKGKEFGSTGGGVTLERSKLDFSQTSKTKSAPQLDDNNNNGGLGNNNIHGGGDNDGGGDDDDKYFDDDDDEEEPNEGGLFGKRILFAERFERELLEAVMKEWYRTMSDLPAGFKQAYEMGMVSTAQLVRFFSINARPTLSRTLYRMLPTSLPKLLADPSWFPYKVLLEQAATIGYGIWWECKHRGERIKNEWDLAACNILTMAACNLVVVWSLAPTRSYSSTFKYEFQNVIQKLPGNIFDRSYKFREYDMTKRLACLLYKAGMLTAVGAIIGTAGAGLSKACLALRKKRAEAGEETSLPLPSIKTSAAGYGAFLGLSGNMRYQLVYGAERVLQEHFNHIGFVLLCSTALRLVCIRLGDATRVALLGLDAEATRNKSRNAHRRPAPSLESIKQGLSGLLDPKNLTSPGNFGKRKVKRRVMAVQ